MLQWSVNITLGRSGVIRGLPLLMALAILSFPELSLATPALPVINTNNVIVVTSPPYNAVGDGVTTDTTAIQNAINAAKAGGTTNGAAGGTVEIPPGTYLCGPLTLASAVNLQIDAGAILRMLPYGMYPGGTNLGTTFITANNLHDIEISGSGAIDGQGAAWWPFSTVTGAKRPVMIGPNSCTRILIQNVTLSNSPMFHIAIGGSSVNSTVQWVTVRAPGSSPNTDACDVSGNNVLVQNCNISEGDDDFTCGGGTSNVLLTNNTYGTGHGISIGSYTDDGGVSNIMVINCTMNGTVNGIRIKSDNDRGGLVQDINYINISMTNVNYPIQVYSYYNEIGGPTGITPLIAAQEPVAAVTSTEPAFRNITFSNITATAASGYPIGIIWARTEMPATNLVFYNLNLTGYQNFCLYNVNGAQFVNPVFHLPAGTTNFAMFDARIIITNNAPTSTVFTFDGLTTNGYANSFAFYNTAVSTSNTNAFGAGPLTLAASALAVTHSLSLAPATTINYTLGTNATKLAVAGNLTLGGTNTVSAGAGFTNGVYTVMTYTGALSGSAPTLASVPAGYTYAFDTSTAGEVNLDVVGAASTPNPPANFTATAGNQTVILAWSPSANAVSYTISRATTNNGGYSPLATGVSATNYIDTQVTNGATYYYVVAGVNAVGTGANSAVASATPEPPGTLMASALVFNDIFSASSVDSLSPTPPTTLATSYEVVSSKSWSPTPSVSAGHLKFGIGSTSSGSVEVQALFTNSPIVLTSISNAISLTVVFTNTSGLLTQSGAMGFGLYNSGGNYPVPGGLNSTATTSGTGNTNGNAQPWAGYVGQVAFTGASSQIMTRSSQLGTGNNNQDLVTSGSGSSSYNTPAAVAVGAPSASGSVTLAAGNPYTEVLVFTLAATNTLAITNFLYSGTSTNGALLSQFGGIASGGTYFTNAFDALAIGWRATASTSATAIDINQISINATLTGAVPVVSLNPTNLTAQIVGGQWQLSWPADHLGWRLQAQTNSLDGGLGANWATVANSTNVDQVSVPIDPANGAVFYRLIYP